MALDCDGTGDYLARGSTPITAYPFSMGCWFNPDNITANHTLMSIYVGSSEHTLRASGAVASDPLRYTCNDGGGAVHAGVNGFTAGSWQFAGLAGRSATSRDVYLGSTKGSNATSRTPTGLTSFDIGGSGGAALLSGLIAHAFIYDIDLTDAEFAILAKGAHPFTIRPQNLVAYWPLVRDPYTDWMAGTALTINGNPTVAVHPPGIMLPPYRIGGVTKIVAAGGTAVGRGLTDSVLLNRRSLAA